MKAQNVIFIAIISIILLSSYINVCVTGPPTLEPGEILSDEDNTPLDVGTYSSPAVIDWDQDGADDLIVGEGPGQIYLFKNYGTNTNYSFYSEGEFLTYSNGTKLEVAGYSTPSVADWNSDGLVDLIVGSQLGKIYLFQNEGNSSHPLFNTRTLLIGEFENYTRWTAPHIVDWNGDSILDLLVGNFQGEFLYFENNGTATQPSLSTPAVLKSSEINAPLDVGFHSHPFCVDWDEDGLIDLISGDDRGSLTWYKRIANTTTELKPMHYIRDERDNVITVSPITAPCFFDWNKDNQIDLFLGDQTGQIHMFLTSGVPSSSSLPSSTTGSSSTNPVSSVSTSSAEPPLLTSGFLLVIPLFSVVGIILWRKATNRRKR
ncbi:MAG: FG-GAP repeat domain-containing protein [Candidatus Hodarchaeota archaeon]